MGKSTNRKKERKFAMKNGKARIALGASLVILQIVSFLGNAKAGTGFQISFSSPGVLLYDLIVLVSYCFLGIVGVILLVSGIIAGRNRGQDDSMADQESFQDEDEELPGFAIPLSTIMPLLIAIFVIILAIVLILERS